MASVETAIQTELKPGREFDTTHGSLVVTQHPTEQPTTACCSSLPSALCAFYIYFPFMQTENLPVGALEGCQLAAALQGAPPIVVIPDEPRVGQRTAETVSEFLHRSLNTTIPVRCTVFDTSQIK